jgi:hypothetical protein
MLCMLLSTANNHVGMGIIIIFVNKHEITRFREKKILTFVQGSHHTFLR